MDKGLGRVAISKVSKLSVGKTTEFVFKNIGLIFIVGFFLFFISMLVSTILSHIFKFANEQIEEGTIVKYSNDWNVAWIFLTFVHLFILALIYFAIDQYILHNISVPKWLQVLNDNQHVGEHFNINPKSVSATTQKETFGIVPSTEYVFHMILIIIMIEMNSSLVHELHQVANILAHDRDYRDKKENAIDFVKKNIDKLQEMLNEPNKKNN